MMTSENRFDNALDALGVLHENAKKSRDIKEQKKKAAAKKLPEKK